MRDARIRVSATIIMSRIQGLYVMVLVVLYLNRFGVFEIPLNWAKSEWAWSRLLPNNDAKHLQ